MSSKDVDEIVGVVFFDARCIQSNAHLLLLLLLLLTLK